MLKRGLIAAALILAMVLAACTQEKDTPVSSEDRPSAVSGETREEASIPEGETSQTGNDDADAGDGLLTENQITRLEGLYFAADEQVAEGLELPLEKVQEQVMGMVMLDGKRKIAGEDYWVTLLFSVKEPKGFCGVRFQAGIPDSNEAREAVRAVYNRAIELYGEPDPEGKNAPAQTEDFTSAYGSWSLGGGTRLTLEYTGITEQSDEDDIDLIELNYQAREPQE